MILDRGARRPRAVLLALILGAFVALAVPAWAAAAEFTVNSTGDGAKAASGAVCETATPGQCTLRAAIQAANEPGAGTDVIKFSSAVFNGEPTDTITPAALPEVSTAMTIDGAACNAGSAVPCLSAAAVTSSSLFEFKADETTLENLSITIPAGRVGIRLAGGNHTVKILDNTIDLTGTTLPSTGIESSFGSSGGLIEGNEITSLSNSFNFPISLRGGSNRILGNQFTGASCCQAGITIELGGAGNQIGGDSPGSENLFEGFGTGAVSMVSSGEFDSTHNEVRRNRGSNGSNFINGAKVAAPAITEAFRSSVGGTAEPGATVRVFRKATEEPGEIESFLGETEADSVTGAWKVSFAKVPIGTFAAATQTLSGSTSSLGGSATVGKDPAEEQEEKETAEKAAKERQEKEAQEQRDKEAREKERDSGGGSTGAGSTNPVPAPAPAPAPAVAKVAPKVRITAGPRKTARATTAKFRFKVTNVPGAKFECKLDSAKWAKCSAPKTYKHMKPGKHTFRVRAVAGGLTGAVTKYQFTVKT